MELIWPVFTYLLIGVASALSLSILDSRVDEYGDEYGGISPLWLMAEILLWPLSILLCLFIVIQNAARRAR